MLHREIETGSLWWCDCARGEWRGSYCARVDLDHSNKWVCAVIPMQALHYASHLARRGRVDNGITTLASNHDFMSQSGSGTGLLHGRLVQPGVSTPQNGPTAAATAAEIRGSAGIEGGQRPAPAPAPDKRHAVAG